MKAWDSGVKTVWQAFLKTCPSLPDNVFFFNWGSQITGCGFIDLIFFSACTNMKYVLCKEQSFRISYICIDGINTLNLLFASQKHAMNNKPSNPCIHFLWNFTLNVFLPRGDWCLFSAGLSVWRSSWVYVKPSVCESLQGLTVGRWQDLCSRFSAVLPHCKAKLPSIRDL